MQNQEKLTVQGYWHQIPAKSRCGLLYPNPGRAVSHLSRQLHTKLPGMMIWRGGGPGSRRPAGASTPAAPHPTSVTPPLHAAPHRRTGLCCVQFQRHNGSYCFPPRLSLLTSHLCIWSHIAQSHPPLASYSRAAGSASCCELFLCIVFAPQADLQLPSRQQPPLRPVQFPECLA